MSFTTPIALPNLNGSNGFRLDGVAASDLSSFSVASAGDVNGDGLADLIVGAYGANPNGVTDAGSSYVVFGKASGWSSAISLATLNGSNGFRLDGVATNDFSGRSVASAGDVNGDGFADLIVGAPSADPDGITNAGSSYVVFGKASGWASTISLATLNGSNGFRLDGVATSDLSGISVASAGDVNGDGFADLIVGASGADPNGVANAGSSYVVFGKATGWSPMLKLATLNGSTGFRLDGVANGEGSGSNAASAGDVNGDGFADLIVGALTADPNGLADAGSSYVVFGKAGGWSPTISFSTLNGSNGFRLDGVATGDLSGRSVASAGDVNGDGFADLIIGADHADPNGLADAGASYVVFGKASGWSSTINLASLDGSNGFRLNGVATRDFTGASVASAGDVNGDGFADLIVSADGADPNGVSNAGSNYVVFGKASGWSSTIDLSTLDGSNGVRLDGAALNINPVASAGDVDGDGFADLIVAAPGGNPGITGAGSTFVYFSPATGGAFDRGTSLADTLRGTPDGDTINGYAGNDKLFGNAGNDTMDGGAGNDIMDGGAGIDTASFASAASAVFYGLLAQGTAFDTQGAGTDTLSNFENLTGGAFNDTLGGDLGANTLDGGAGDDSLFAWNGGDSLMGGLGNDMLYGSSGAPDTLAGGAGNDTYQINSANTVVQESGGGGTDIAFVSVNGWTASGNLEAVYLAGSAVLLSGAAASVNVLVANVMLGSSLMGGSGADTLYGQAGDDTLMGGGGDDVIRAGSGRDVLNGGAGRDQLVGGAGADIFQCNAPGWGYDQIFDFVRGTDKLDLNGTGANRFADLTVYQVGGNTVVQFGADRIDLYGVTGLSASDFIFG